MQQLTLAAQEIGNWQRAHELDMRSRSVLAMAGVDEQRYNQFRELGLTPDTISRRYEDLNRHYQDRTQEERERLIREHDRNLQILLQRDPSLVQLLNRGDREGYQARLQQMTESNDPRVAEAARRELAKDRDLANQNESIQRSRADMSASRGAVRAQEEIAFLSSLSPQITLLFYLLCKIKIIAI